MYANLKYYFLKYNTENQTMELGRPYRLFSLPFLNEQLKNTKPKAMRSHANLHDDSHCIVDTDNNLHCYFTGDNTEAMYTNICKVTLSDFQIMGFRSFYRDDIHTCSVLLRNLKERKFNAYEYFTFECTFGATTLKKHRIYSSAHINYGNNSVTINTDYDYVETYPYFSSRHAFRSFGHRQLKDISYNPLENYGVDEIHAYDCTDERFILVINNGECFIKCHANAPRRRVCSLTDKSKITYDGRSVNIITGSHVIVIKEYNDIFEYTLPFHTVNFIGHNKIADDDIVWSRQTHNLMSSANKDIITSVMLHNRRNGNLKMPYGVLQIIFNYVVNGRFFY